MIRLYGAHKKYFLESQTHQLERKGLEKVIKKESGYNTDLKTKIITTEKECFMLIKISIHQEGITITNKYALNNRTQKYKD